jgi:hypothetical protein
LGVRNDETGDAIRCFLTTDFIAHFIAVFSVVSDLSKTSDKRMCRRRSASRIKIASRQKRFRNWRSGNAVSDGKVALAVSAARSALGIDREAFSPRRPVVRRRVH